jgi:hypothetical protein
MIAGAAITSATELPENRNFTWLKTQGLKHLKQLSGDDWTDFNESDPGVTILDQLCYALTELGYCNNFPIEDIVCNTDGEIQTKDQFFTPEKILTSRPVTVNDYRKLVIDATPQLKNIYISFADERFEYDVSVYLDHSIIDSMKSNILRKVDHLLAQHRTIGEYFSCAVVLAPQDIKLEGRVSIEQSVSENDVSSDIKLALDNYISPQIKQYGYQEMLNAGYSSDQIFDGPQLSNGWIPNSELKTSNRKFIGLQDVLRIISSIEGVSSVDELSLNGTNSDCEIQLGHIARLNIDSLVIASVNLKKHSVSPETLSFELRKLRANHAAVKIGSSINLHPQLPSGQYREIEEYYSVQNTFPSIYQIDADTNQANTNPYRTAQTRQLKGYLMVFDQLIADQFSQLGNVTGLFSFKPWARSANSDHLTDNSERHISTGLFSPTYYFQPLYDVPGVKPLLLGNDSYFLSDASHGDLVEQEKAWFKYKRDPFNQYLSGLRDCIETESQRDCRHNMLLDHLLARHGESGSFYDDVIRDAHWCGSVLKSRVILKSLLLQNYHLLSYNRCKAYNYLGAYRLGSPGQFRLTLSGFERIRVRKSQSPLLEGLRYFINRGFAERDCLAKAFEKKFHCTLHYSLAGLLSKLMSDANTQRYDAFYSDGMLDLELIESKAHLHPEKFSNYSSFELLFNLILQLSQRYKRLSAILLALLNNSRFVKWQNSEPSENSFTVIYEGVKLKVERTTNKVTGIACDQILLDGQSMLSILHTGAGINKTYQAHKDQLDWLATQRQGQVFIENVLLLKTLRTPETKSKIGLYGVTTFVPAYVSYCSSEEFSELFNMLSKFHIPAYISASLKPLQFEDLSTVIENYIGWHNNWLGRAPSLNSDEAQGLADMVSHRGGT